MEQVFPEEKLPSADEHRLDVVLTAPMLFDEPEAGEIVLPECGPSTEIGFSVSSGRLLEQNPRGSLGRTPTGNELARLSKVDPGARQDH
jgi:hypothetical protein